jgi:4-hydroxy-4-methyl-2-oxoglutarate aldolase
MGLAPAVEDSRMSERVRFETQETAAEGFGVSTIYEAAGRSGLVDLELIAILPDARVAGRARTVLCGQDDNLMVPAAIAHVRSGEILVIRMPESRPVSMLGGLLAEQCVARGVKGVLVDAAVRDVAEIRALGLPVWTRHVRARSAAKRVVGRLDAPLEIGGATIAAGDLVVMDADGAVAVPAARVDEVLAVAAQRDAQERVKLERYRRGELSYDLDGLRALVERS